MKDDHADDLKIFYESQLGKKIYNNIFSVIKEIWPSANSGLIQHQTILGYGYASKYLKNLNNNNLIFNLVLNEKLIDGSRGEILLNSNKIPLGDDSIDKIIAIHSLEYQNDFASSIKEIWRVLKPSGKVIFIIPNKMSIWSNISTSPFFYEKSFTYSEITKNIAEYMFSILRNESTLYFMPHFYNILPKFANNLDKLGNKISKSFGGIMFIEAEKRLISTPQDESCEKKLCNNSDKKQPSFQKVSNLKQKSETNS